VTTHVESILDALPTLYRDGPLVRGLAEVLALQLEIIDEQARIIQRSHWFDATPELAEAAALGALLDVPAEEWQSLDEYRAWFHTLRDSRLRAGAVTVPALQEFVSDYANRFERANDGVRLVGPFELDTWSAQPIRTGHAFVENPPRYTGDRLAGPGGGTEPLTRHTVVNGALDTAPLHLLLTGTGDGEFCPVVVNLTTGQALVYPDALRTGDRLWVHSGDDGALVAQHGRADVTAKMRAVQRVTPGAPWAAADAVPATRPIELRPGSNELWFLPVAHYGAPGLDRVLLALADLELTQGRFDAARFDRALYAQEAGVIVAAAWTERVRAAIRIDLDAGVLRCPAGHTDNALEARDQLEGSVRAGVGRLVAAGVAAEVRFRPLHDSQRQLDHLVFIDHVTNREPGSVGIDRIADAGGLFSVTDFGDSTFQ
jgi:hypothetical protein